MISLEEARALVAKEARSFGKEIIWLDEANGRVLQEPLVADRDYPPFNRATMDGIAIRSSDWKKGLRSFNVAETIFAGRMHTVDLNEGDCYRIMTGAAVPAGADMVIRKEDIAEAENSLTVTASEVREGQNIAPRGSDLRQGQLLFEGARLIQPKLITTLAALGYAEVKVASLPSVAIATTGNEVMPVDMPVNEVQIRNSNGALLKALLEEWKIQPVVMRHLPDDEAVILQWIKQQQRHQLIIMSGAVSAGDADYVPAMLEKAGALPLFHRIAIRPGKPCWFGKFDNGPVVFALPGNPFSTFVTFKLLIDFYLRHCFGLPKVPLLSLPLQGSRFKQHALDEFFPVSLEPNPPAVKALPFNTSGDITAVLNADALAWHRADQAAIKEGELVECMMMGGELRVMS